MKAEILNKLRAENGYISGEELSRHLGVSRTAVWKNIKALREEGYVIDSVTNKGYRLIEAPDRLEPRIILSGLDTLNVGKRIIALDKVDSTNDEVKRRAAQGEEGGLIIAAENQTGGKGRFGRKWSSRGGGIYFSVLLRPDLPPNAIPSITLAAGYGVCLAVREYTGLDARIKWPNDIVIGRRKLCGILTEMAAQSDMLDYVAIGIGINVNHAEFPEEIRDKATSLYIETGKKTDRNDFFRCVIKNLDKSISSFLVGFSSDDANNFKELCVTIGRQVTINRAGGNISGTAYDITPAGELMVKTDDGTELAVNSGEVTVQGIY